MQNEIPDNFYELYEQMDKIVEKFIENNEMLVVKNIEVFLSSTISYHCFCIARLLLKSNVDEKESLKIIIKSISDMKHLFEREFDEKKFLYQIVKGMFYKKDR